MKAFSKMINEVNDLAGQRELISEYLEAEVCIRGIVLTWHFLYLDRHFNIHAVQLIIT